MVSSMIFNRYRFAYTSREWQAFTNPCRKDTLVLNHWVKKLNAQPTAPEAPATPAESRVDDGKGNQTRSSGSHWAQYDHKVVIPEYDDELYEAQLESKDWTREETDYLFQLVKDFELRWTVIADRYDYLPKEVQSSDDSMAVTMTAKNRTMEDMKARYYHVASKAIVIKQPPASMSEQEFEAYECMIKFDPTRETTRKRLAEALLARSPEEIKEEETLLSELKRIHMNEEKFLQERKELYSRLDHPVAPIGSIAAYESSAGLNQLAQNLFHADKNKKRRSMTGAGDNNSSPAHGTPSQHTPSLSRDHRGSIGGHPATKKGSGGSGPRQLSARDEAKFGVSNHERLSSGVSFRSGRIDKLILAKSASQSQKLQGVIAQLGLPLRAVMATTRICDEYEQLVQNIHKLLDVRKHSEKTSNEIKILTAQRETRLKRERGEEDCSMLNSEDVEGQEPREDQENIKEDSDADADADVDADADDDAEEDAEGEDEVEADTSVHHNEDEDEEGGNDDAEAEGAEVEDEDDADADADVAAGDQDEEVDEDEDDDEEDAGPEEEDSADDAGPGGEETRASVAPSIRSTRSTDMHKRSASSMSALSEKSTKRQKQ